MNTAHRGLRVRRGNHFARPSLLSFRIRLRRGHARHQFEDFLPAGLSFALKNHDSLMEPEDGVSVFISRWACTVGLGRSSASQPSGLVQKRTGLQTDSTKIGLVKDGVLETTVAPLSWIRVAEANAIGA